jgi:hypothetical protein
MAVFKKKKVKTPIKIKEKSSKNIFFHGDEKRKFHFQKIRKRRQGQIFRLNRTSGFRPLQKSHADLLPSNSFSGSLFR